MSIVRGSVVGTILESKGTLAAVVLASERNGRAVLPTGERRTRKFNVRGSGIEEGS